jgi:Zn-dependent protease
VLLFGEPSVELIIAIAMLFLISLPFHEFSHALAAYRLGDDTAASLGRLTLNPVAHIDPIGGLLILVSGFGWAKPTPYNPFRVRGGRTGEAIIAFAGPASNLVLAVAAAIPLRYILSSGIEVPAIVALTLLLFIQLNIGLMIFNLIPVVPLDGSKVLFAFLDPETERRVRPILEQYGLLILIGLMFLPILPGGETVIALVFREIAFPLMDFLVGRRA